MTDVGIVLGHQASTSQTFQVGLADDQSLAVDDLVAVTIPEPSGEVIAYGGGGPHCITQQVPAVTG